MMRVPRRWLRRVGVGVLLLALSAGVAAAHGGSLRATQQALAVPGWLVFSTGGAAVGASFLLASFVTDRAYIRSVHAATRVARLPVIAGLTRLTQALGVLGLLAVVVVGVVGPTDPLQNLAVLVVWGGWWAGFTVSTYAVGNVWPALNPWRTVAGALPTLDRAYPDRLGAWPAVVGLLGLIWLEVVSPLADDPRLLAGVVVTYTLVTLGGSVLVGEAWFDRVDPVSQVFRLFGRVAPVTREGGTLRLRVPGSALTDPVVRDASEEALIVALLWATTYDGLVGTRAFATALPTLLDPVLTATGLTALARPLAVFVVYPLVLGVGFLAFRWVFHRAARSGVARAESYLDAGTFARRFAPSLLAIAAGYHAAHYLGYFLQLLPSLLGAAASPLAPPAPVYLVLPGWFGTLELAFVLLGHWLAVWVAHAVGYDLFPGRLQSVRSQYALTAVMVGYTMLSLFIVSQPFAQPPYL